MPLIDEFEIGDEFQCGDCGFLRVANYIGKFVEGLYDTTATCPVGGGFGCYTPITREERRRESLERKRGVYRVNAEIGIRAGDSFICGGCGNERMITHANSESVSSMYTCPNHADGFPCSAKLETFTPENPPPKLESTPACTCDMQTLMRVGCPSNQGQRCPSAGV